MCFTNLSNLHFQTLALSTLDLTCWGTYLEKDDENVLVGHVASGWVSDWCLDLSVFHV